MNEQRNDEEEADFLTEMMEEKPQNFSQQPLEDLHKEAKFYMPINSEAVKKTIPPDLEKTLELFKKLLKSNEVNFLCKLIIVKIQYRLNGK